MQVLEGVLDHVLGGGPVAGHQHGEPDQLQVVLPEQSAGPAQRMRGFCVHVTKMPGRPEALRALRTRRRPGAADLP
jgi:hypothetical protein